MFTFLLKGHVTEHAYELIANKCSLRCFALTGNIFSS